MLMTLITLQPEMFLVPVLITPGLSFIHSAIVRPKKNENPKMKRFLPEFMSTYCRLEIPTATIIPAIISTYKIPTNRSILEL